MEFHVTEELAGRRADQLASAGAALGIKPTFVAVEKYAPGSREDFARYLSDNNVEFFSVDEVVKPHNKMKARKAGFEEFVPPLHLWPWAMLVLRLGDEVRRRVGRPVKLRNLYRPMSYNRLVATSGIDADHPNACAGDFDFRSQDDRRTAEALIRDRASELPDLEISLGMGGQSLHVGVMSPKGTRYWFYKSYSDARVPLSSSDRSEEPADTTGDEDEPAEPKDEEVERQEPSSDEADVSEEPLEPAGDNPVRLAPLDEAVRRRVIEQTAVFESHKKFEAMFKDGEFSAKGLENHPAFGRYHIGLSYGYVQFTQDSGTLGRLLQEMERRDPGMFHEIFGEHSAALLKLTTMPGPSSKKTPPRGTRVQPLDGADLWEEPWIDRFKRAGAHPPFQEAQLFMASVIYLDPMLQFAHWLGLNTDRALGMVFDRSVHMGRGGARRWIMGVVGPITDKKVLERALESYGFANLLEFQRSVEGLKPDGAFGPITHAALCFHERQRGENEDVVLRVPDRNTMLDKMVVASAERPSAKRIGILRGRPDEPDAFDDVEIDLIPG